MFSQHVGATIPVVDPSAADGAFSLLWLVVALPALGATLANPLARTDGGFTFGGVRAL